MYKLLWCVYLMTIVSICRFVRDIWDRAMDRCYHLFPCLSDPGTFASFNIFILWRNFFFFLHVKCLYKVPAEESFFIWLKTFVGFSLVIVIMTFVGQKSWFVSIFRYKMNGHMCVVVCFNYVNFWKFGLGFDVWEVGFSSEIFAGSEIGVGDAASDIRWHSLSVWWRFDRKDKTRAMVC